MHAISFTPAHVDGARSTLFNMETEYLSWVQDEMEKCFPRELIGTVSSLLADDPCPLQLGCSDQRTGSQFYLIEVAGQAAGMCGMRLVSGRAAEVKRLYVRTGFRGMRVGSLALGRLIEDAYRFGCAQLLLDSAPFMKAAHLLYETHGFTDCPAYEGSEVPVSLHGHWRFMQKNLQGAVA